MSSATVSSEEPSPPPSTYMVLVPVYMFANRNHTKWPTIVAHQSLFGPVSTLEEARAIALREINHFVSTNAAILGVIRRAVRWYKNLNPGWAKEPVPHPPISPLASRRWMDYVWGLLVDPRVNDEDLRIHLPQWEHIAPLSASYLEGLTEVSVSLPYFYKMEGSKWTFLHLNGQGASGTAHLQDIASSNPLRFKKPPTWDEEKIKESVEDIDFS